MFNFLIYANAEKIFVVILSPSLSLFHFIYRIFALVVCITEMAIILLRFIFGLLPILRCSPRTLWAKFLVCVTCIYFQIITSQLDYITQCKQFLVYASILCLIFELIRCSAATHIAVPHLFSEKKNKKATARQKVDIKYMKWSNRIHIQLTNIKGQKINEVDDR